jgi:hypothetical protein
MELGVGREWFTSFASRAVLSPGPDPGRSFVRAAFGGEVTSWSLEIEMEVSLTLFASALSLPSKPFAYFFLDLPRGLLSFNDSLAETEQTNTRPANERDHSEFDST